VLEGVPLESLRIAAAMAADQGLFADRVVLARGLVDEDAFYAALARHLGLPCLRGRIRVDTGKATVQSLAAGLVPLWRQGGVRFAVAPEGAHLAELLNRPRGRLSGLAVTTPTRLRDAVWQAIGPVAMEREGQGPAAAAPALSARDVSRGAGATAIALVLVLLGAIALPAGVGVLVSLGLSILFMATIALRLTATAARLAATQGEGAMRFVERRALPVYTVVVALHDEAAVMPQLCKALSRLHYPPEKLDLKLVLEEGDEATIAAARAWRGLPRPDLVICPPGMPRTKPRALNAALMRAKGALVVVFDAEDVPDPDQLWRAASVFARAPASLACLQARLAIDNTGDSWLTRLFTLEYAAWFDVVLPGLARLGLPIPLGGTSNHFRRDPLLRAMGWDAWNVTEDADLGLRLARLGYRVATIDSVTHEEAPADLRRWLRQRTRWLKGWMQTAIVHHRQPIRLLRELGPLGFAVLTTHTAGTIASALGFPVLLAAAGIGVLRGTLLLADDFVHGFASVLAVEVFLLGPTALLVPALVAARTAGLGALLPWLALLPAYLMLVSAAAWLALLELFRAPSHWHKTAHGLARTSRRRDRLDAFDVQAARRPAAPNRP
jgi:cellulose synthase/poly-beta-1,6-N-acetylglucosamine synthase-like glycosyltransferase